MSSEESELEDEQNPITGETRTKLVSFVTKKKQSHQCKDEARPCTPKKNFTPHARQMAKPRRVEGDSDGPKPDGPA